jgi:PST family polysaccharide transporter
MRKPVDQNLVSSTTSAVRPTPDRLRHSLLSQGGAQVFKLLVSIGIGGWTARYLGPQNIGDLSYVGALVGLLSPLGSLGVKGSLSAMLCEEQPLPGLLGSALLVELAGTLVIGLVLIPFAWSARDPVIAGLIGLAVVGNLFGSSEVFEVELINRQRGTQLARIGSIQTVVGALLSVLALLIQAPLLVFGALPAIQAAMRGWLLGVAVQAEKPLLLLKQASWQASRALIQRGWPLLLAGLSVMLYMKSDQVMLQWLRGPEDVGQYSVAVRVAESLYFLPVVLSSTFLPKIGRGTGQFDTDPALRQLYRCAWLLGVGVAATSMFLLPPLIPLVFGDQFLPAQAALISLGPAAFGVAIGCASGVWLQIMGYDDILWKRTALGGIANIALNIILMKNFGFIGAAVATTAAQIIANNLLQLVDPRTRSNQLNALFPYRNL